MQPIQSHEKYRVDREGNVYGQKGNVLNAVCNGTGYYRVSLYTDKVQHTKYVHRLVAEAYVPNPDNLPVVNHIDRDTANNRADNLEWCTQQKNVEHSAALHYQLVSPEGIPTVIYNLDKFCREHGMDSGNTHKVLSGQRSHHKGWTLPSTN